MNPPRSALAGRRLSPAYDWPVMANRTRACKGNEQTDVSHPRSAEAERIADRSSRGKEGVARAGSDARADRSGRHLGGPFVQFVDSRRIGGVLRRTLELQRRGNGRYSDFPVAAVEIWLAATDVFARWRRVVLGHFLLRGTLTSWDISSCSGNVSRFTGMTAECGRNTQQMVSYRGISDRRKSGFMLTDQGTSRPLGPHIPRSAQRNRSAFSDAPSDRGRAW